VFIISYSRKKFKLTLPIREIQESDASQEFVNELTPINDIDLEFLVPYNVDDRYIFVYDLDDRVMAFLTFYDKVDHYHLDLVETNRMHPESDKLNPGIALILTLEGLSRNANFDIITLHSTPDNIGLYQSRGYVVNGESYYFSDYNVMLTPMIKHLT